MFLLDTNVVSELRKGTRANKRVYSWFLDVGALRGLSTHHVS